MKKEYLPHYKCYTRLAPSKIHGVGLFAICKIKRGIYIFYNDNNELKEVKTNKIKKLSKNIKKLYSDFCPIQNDKYMCPSSFNKLNVTWYLNHSNNPNINCDNNYNFYANRDIKLGEELTVDYSTYDSTWNENKLWQ